MRYIAFLFLMLVPILGVWTFVDADAHGWWFPENHSTFGGEIDHLFNVILWMVGITFVVTEGLLAWYFFKYSARRHDKAVFTDVYPCPAYDKGNSQGAQDTHP